DRDHVSSANRCERLRQWQTLHGFKPKTTNGDTSGGDLGFAVNFAPVVQFGDEANVINRCGIDVSFAREDFGRQANRFNEIASHIGERRKKQVSKTVTSEIAGSAKSIAKKAREQR